MSKLTVLMLLVCALALNLEKSDAALSSLSDILNLSPQCQSYSGVQNLNLTRVRSKTLKKLHEIVYNITKKSNINLTNNLEFS